MVDLELVLPLLQICHNFRDIVYKCFCRCYSIDLAIGAKELTTLWDSWPYRFKILDHGAFHL
ncbi:hypothetical protein GGI21_004387, partial [Coemansia aciculifera]